MHSSLVAYFSLGVLFCTMSFVRLQTEIIEPSKREMTLEHKVNFLQIARQYLNLRSHQSIYQFYDENGSVSSIPKSNYMSDVIICSVSCSVSNVYKVVKARNGSMPLALAMVIPFSHRIIFPNSSFFVNVLSFCAALPICSPPGRSSTVV